MRRGRDRHTKTVRSPGGVSRRRRRVALFAAIQTLLGLGLIVVAAPANAAGTPIWSITTVTDASTIARAGGMVTLTATCPSGTTPISGGYTAYTANPPADIRRVTESTNWGDGASYSVDLVDEVAHVGGASDSATATVNCAPISYFSGEVTKFGSFPVGADNTAAGSVACDPGYFALSASVTFNNSSDGTVLTSTPDLEFDGWYAKGYRAVANSSLWVFAHCVPTSDIPGARVYQHSDDAGWGTVATSDCPSGLRPITGGTYHVGGDGGGITVTPHATSTGWSSLSESTSGGTMYTNLICIAAALPTVSLSAGATPAANSTSARWTFSATDPSAAGDYGTITFTCSLSHFVANGPIIQVFKDQACSSPLQLDNLDDATYELVVLGHTGDGRIGGNTGDVPIDTVAPVVGFVDDANTIYASHSPALPVQIVDAHGVTVTCVVDAAPRSCPRSFPSGTGHEALNLSGVTEGAHTLHVSATDAMGNSSTSEFPFRIDTTPPTVTQTGPSTHFTASRTVKVTWTGKDRPAGVAGYAVQWQRASDHGGFGSWSSPVSAAATATARSFGSLSRGYTYCFHVRGTDKVGNTSTWTASRCAAIPLDDRDLADSSGWHKVTPSGYLQNTALVTTRKGSTLAVTGVTLRRVAVVAKTCPSCGKVGLYVGSTRIGTIDLHAGTAARKVIALPAFSLRTGTVKLKVLSSGKTVQIDGLGVSRK